MFVDLCSYENCLGLRGIIKTLGILLLFSSVNLFAQSDTLMVRKGQILVVKDSVIVPQNDTIAIISRQVEHQVLDDKFLLSDGFYDSVYSVAQRRRVTKELYNLLIVNNSTNGSFSSKEPVNSESFFQAFQGKTIRKIEYVSVDLFGGSVNDTTQKAQSRIGMLSNDLHRHTKDEVIAKHLLFSVGDQVNPFVMSDTERVIRSLTYVEDARIVLKIDSKNPDYVHVTIITKDRFPWSLDVSIDGRAFRAGFTNQNILGTGNEFGIGYLYNNREIPENGYDAHYTFRNIKDSFIDATVFASDNYLGRSKGFTLQREFISPALKYYGEATFEHVQPIEDLEFADSLYERDFNVERLSYDVWAAHSFSLGNRRNINAALRIDHDNFARRPVVRADSNIIFHNHHFLVGALSFSKINFLKTRNILSFNITEDIPTGFIFSLFIGNNYNEFGSFPYRGFEAIYSTYHSRFGYFLFDFQSGYMKMEEDRFNQAIQYDIRHFTPLYNLGNAYSRVFTRFHFFNGNRLSIPLAQSLAEENRIPSIDGNQISGNRLITFTSEYVVFQPWYFYGFRFATYGHIGVGHVSENRNLDPYSQTYLTMGGGVRIRNESLVFNTFEFRLSLFPNAPSDGQLFYFKVSISAPRFFESPTVSKPKIIGLDNLIR